MTGLTFFIFCLALFIFVVITKAVTTVTQGNEYTVERFGEYTRTLTPGLHIIIPFFDKIGAKMNMMETVVDVPSQEVITKDNAMVRVDGVVFFQVLNAAQAAYEVNNLTRAILNLTMTNIRTVMGSMDLDQLLSQRDTINAQLLQVVDEATSPWGVKVTRIEIKDISPPKDLVDSMARQMKADGEKRAAILEAEGRKESAFRDAEARERLAEAEAKATTDVSNAIATGDIQAVNYFVATKYVDALKDIAAAPNTKVVLMPLEASSVIGSIAGITEIAKETFSKNKPND